MCLCIRSTVSNTLLMSNATVIVCAGALFWLKTVAMMCIVVSVKLFIF